MASYDIPSSHFAGNIPCPASQVNQHLYPYHKSPSAPNVHCHHRSEELQVITALHRRIAVLETELAHANTDKLGAENATRSLLKIVAEHDGQLLSNGKSSKDVSRLEDELFRRKVEKLDLKRKLREVIQLWRNAVRVQPETRVQEGLCKPSPHCSCIRSGHKEACPDSENSGTTFVDLMDMELPANNPPALDNSDGSLSVSEDNLDEYIQSLPMIDEGLRKTSPELVEDGRESCNQMEQINQSNLQRFSGGLTESFEDSKPELVSSSPEDTSLGIPVNKMSNRFCTAGKDRQHHTISDPRVTLTSGATSPLISNGLSESRHAVVENAPDDSAPSLSTFSQTPAESSDCLKTQIIEKRGEVSQLEDKTLPRYIPDWNNQSATSKTTPESTTIYATCGAGKIFRTKFEREIAIVTNKNGAGPEDLLFPDIFRFGIRYKPSPNEANFYRTISIMNLPPNLTISALLGKVRGGLVLSVELLDTASITGSFSALVTFLHESSAIALEEFAMENPIYFGAQRAEVKLLNTPTWPLRIPLRVAIFDHGHTRCIEICNFPRHISPSTLRHDLRSHKVMDADSIEYMHMRGNGVLELRFTSIAAAGKAYGILTGWRPYQQCRVFFSKDPCALPLAALTEAEEIQADAELPCVSASGKAGQDELGSSLTHDPDAQKNRNDSTGATTLVRTLQATSLTNSS